MKRRTFLEDVALGSLLLKVNPLAFAQPKGRPDLALIQGESPSQITREAIAALGGIGRFISKGDVVIIKPNIGWDRTPEMAACTNPEVVKTLVELARSAEAKKVIVLDNSTNQANRCYVRSGIEAAAKEAGAQVLLPNPQHLKKMSLRGEWLKEWEVFTDFVEADKIINVPIAKSHSLCRLTLGLKNWLGAVGGNRSQLHQKLDQAMLDLAIFFKPTLTVMDAYRILIRNGPQGGRISDTKLLKTVVAGVDFVAVDAMAATFFEIKPEELLYLKLAQERGIGKIDLEKLNIEKRTI